MARITVVDDEDEFLEYTTALLRGAGHAVTAHATAGKFLDSLSASPPDLAVLDLRMPGVSGWELVRILRDLEATRTVPIIAVSGEYRGSEHVVRALALGVDEYFVKPFDAEIFLAKVSALLRKAASAPPVALAEQRLAVRDISVDIAQHTARVGAREVHLTPLEFDLLVHLIRNRNRVLTRGLILQQVWRSEPSQSTRTVDKRVEVLRRKLGRSGSLIQTVSGVGYCLRCP
jgi:DNA-binding response OmpR family regulator